jgi:hypothetical protein
MIAFSTLIGRGHSVNAGPHPREIYWLRAGRPKFLWRTETGRFPLLGPGGVREEHGVQSARRRDRVALVMHAGLRGPSDGPRGTSGRPAMRRDEGTQASGQGALSAER